MPAVIDNGSTGRIPLYCVLVSDHISPATGKTVAVTISKNGSAFGNPSAGATNATEIGSGWYYWTPSATDTGTNGPLIVLGTNADIDNSTRDYLIAPSIPKQVWDEVNTGATHNITNSTGKQLRSLTVNTAVIYSGTAPSQAGMTSTQIKLDAGASAVNQVYQWTVISIISGTDAGDSAIISDYNGSTKVATVEIPWAIQPDNTSVFEITPTPKVQTVGTVSGNIVSVNGTTFAGANVPCILADGVAHGGTPGSSTATLAMQAVNVTNPSGTAVHFNSTADGYSGFWVQCLTNAAAMTLQGSGDPSGALTMMGGGTYPTMEIDGASTGGPPCIALFPSVGPAIKLNPPSTGNLIEMGTTDGHVLVITAAGTGKKAILLAGDAATDALAIAAGAGTPIDVFNADGSVNVGGIDAAALAQFFTVDSGTTYASAVAGSVVKEISTNAGGGVDAATIAAAVWNEVNTASTHNIDNSTGKQLRAISGSSITIYSSTLPSQSGVPANQVKLDAGASSSNGAYVGAAMWAVSGTGQGGGVCISYIGSTRMATIHTNWAVAPVGGDVVEVVPTGIATVAGYISGQDPATLVWDAPVRTLTDFGFTVTIGGLPPIPNNWITANGINAAALNGKGDWLTTKTGYSLDLTQAIPATNGVATMGDALNAALSMGFGNQIVDASAKTLTMYQRNGNTIVKTFNLDSATAPKTRT